ncbi:ATP-binding cassette domain-containing protein [Gilvimarinus algae]|uniref:ATP-binding cassette domain-containing protein n=1 Tax=Gilvimarinus algae TaxID=3058037 RepID=A0ABT8TIN7_9GAMM|nr:ATP-binding cassette domain-containing protein [Gilvimarinus sp. SDUM040014]MDO3383349.1 ATP-binding cassette domain-containing protein [Gilvimarinus sp. SDUM040014]
MWHLEARGHKCQWAEGEWLAISGPSGCGKTQLLTELAAGKTGQFGIRGTDLFALAPAARGLGWAAQGALLWPAQTVASQINALQKKHGAERTEKLCEELGVTPLLARHTETLSGGERQRVALLSALISAHRLVLLDEPVSALDEAAARQVLRVARRYCAERGLSAILVSHQWRDIEASCDRVYLWQSRELLELATAHQRQVQQAPSEAAALWPIEQRAGHLKVRGQALDTGPLPAHTRRIRIDAHDVSLARQRPVLSSIGNTLEVEIIDIEALDHHSVIITLNWNDLPLYALVTPRAVKSLELTRGLTVFAQFKAHSVKAA